MTKVTIKRNGVLKLQGCLLVGDIDREIRPLKGAGEHIWKHAELTKDHFICQEELQDGDIRITKAGKLSPGDTEEVGKEKKKKKKKKKEDDAEGTYTAILHIVVTPLNNLLPSEQISTLKQLYDKILVKAVAMEAKSIVIPFLGIQSFGVSIQDGVDAALIAIRDFLTANNYKEMCVDQIFLMTTNDEISKVATKHPIYKEPVMRGKLKKQNMQENSRLWSCVVARLRDSRMHSDLPVAQSACGGMMQSLSTMTFKTAASLPDEIARRILFGASHEADLIMSRIGEFRIDWSSQAALQLEICNNHLDRLSRDWDNQYYKNVKYRDNKAICSFPDHQGIRGAPIPFIKKGNADKVNKEDAIRWFKRKRTVIQAGAPICEADKESREVKSLDIWRQEWNSMEKMPSIPQKTPSTASVEVKTAVVAFLGALKFKEVGRRKDWVHLVPRQQRKKATMVRTGVEAMTEVLAPDAKAELKALALGSSTGQDNDRTMLFKQQLANAADLYERTESKTHRLFILSSVAFLKRDMLLPFFPDLTNYMYKKAKRVICNPNVQDIRILRERYDRTKVDLLIGFLTGPRVVLNLPFNERSEKMDDGSTLNLPNYMRLQTIDEVYRMYKSFLIEKGVKEMLLMETTAKYIIKLVAPTRRKNLTCVDEKVADGMQAFDDMFSMITDLEKKGFLIKDASLQLTRALQQSKAYLRGDFKVHIQKFSNCADHCATLALSDPEEQKHAIDCSMAGEHAHQHDSLCDRCEMVKTSMNVLREALENAADTGADAMEREHFESKCEELDVCREAVEEMKKHQVRAAVSHGERADVVEKLKEGEALVTLDWAQKMEPLHARERQSDYYAKTGISYHISHAVARINGEYAEHTSVHIVGPSVPQDGCAVSLITESFLQELKEMGVGSVIIRSGNAGCYKNGPLMRSLIDMQEKIGITVESYLFSEAQAGKSACDRGSASVKRKTRDVVASLRTKVETKENFYDVLTHGKLLNGFSIHLCTISEVKTVKCQIPHITSFSSFVFESSAIRLRKHRSIGEGILFDFKKLRPCDGVITISKSGGYTVQSGDKFWMTHAVREEKETSTELTSDAPTPNTLASRMLPCPEESCRNEFISFRELDKHLIRGKHTLKKERKTMHDYCASIVASSLDTLFSITTTQLGIALRSSVHNGMSDLSDNEGWALRSTKRPKKDDKEARKLITEYFQKKRKDGKKCNPHEAELHMKTKKTDGSGKLHISPRNRLSISQIKSLIRRLLREEDEGKQKSMVKKKKIEEEDSEEEGDQQNDLDDEEETDDEAELNELVKKAFDECEGEGERMDVDAHDEFDLESRRRKKRIN